ncbi:MAG: hypothetical protein NZ556_01085 [Fimbriimonadales bacterium]|nr:hypothetical protein [Fimbriimonadales bacterium]
MASGIRLRLRSRVRDDGVLELHAPTSLPAGEVEVGMWIQPLLSQDNTPTGTPGSALLDLAGSLPEDLADQMLQAVEKECERVNTE